MDNQRDQPSQQQWQKQPAYQATQYGQPPPAYPPQQPYGQPPYGYPPQQGYLPQVAKPTGWFIVNWLFFWPSAIYSLVTHWSNIDRAAYSGDVVGAQAHAAAVRKLGIIALCIGLAMSVFIVVVDVAVLSSVSSVCSVSDGSC